VCKIYAPLQSLIFRINGSTSLQGSQPEPAAALLRLGFLDLQFGMLPIGSLGEKVEIITFSGKFD
jgi:hypothetical protein